MELKTKNKNRSTKSTRGGYRRAKPPKDSNAAFLRELIRAYNGYAAFGRYLDEQLTDGLHPQAFLNWALRGAIPALKVAEIAKILKCDPYLLNYKGWKKINSGKAPGWSKLVNDCSLISEPQKKFVLRFKSPE